jgi:hypothetical protein
MLERFDTCFIPGVAQELPHGVRHGNVRGLPGSYHLPDAGLLDIMHH